MKYVLILCSLFTSLLVGQTIDKNISLVVTSPTINATVSKEESLPLIHISKMTPVTELERPSTNITEEVLPTPIHSLLDIEPLSSIDTLIPLKQPIKPLAATEEMIIPTPTLLLIGTELVLHKLTVKPLQNIITIEKEKTIPTPAHSFSNTESLDITIPVEASLEPSITTQKEKVTPTPPLPLSDTQQPSSNISTETTPTTIELPLMENFLQNRERLQTTEETQ
jgi:hypothetical protein